MRLSDFGAASSELEMAVTGHDERGRGVLHRISPLTWVGAAIGAGVRSTMIPPEFWIADEDVAVVSCPCGHEPRVPVLALTACGCHRYYFYTTTEVFALGVTV